MKSIIVFFYFCLVLNQFLQAQHLSYFDEFLVVNTTNILFKVHDIQIKYSMESEPKSIREIKEYDADIIGRSKFGNSYSDIIEECYIKDYYRGYIPISSYPTIINLGRGVMIYAQVSKENRVNSTYFNIYRLDICNENSSIIKKMIVINWSDWSVSVNWLKFYNIPGKFDREGQSILNRSIKPIELETIQHPIFSNLRIGGQVILDENYILSEYMFGDLNNVYYVFRCDELSCPACVNCQQQCFCSPQQQRTQMAVGVEISNSEPPGSQRQVLRLCR